MQNVYLTLNFLFHDWHTPDGELWAIVQPHVMEDVDIETFPNLYSYIRETPDSAKSTFLLWGSGPCDSKHIVPVPFPDNCKVRVKLSTDDGTVLDTPEQNDLSSFLAITKPDIFTVANREPSLVHTDSTPKAPPFEKGAFALAYNKQLREAALSLTAGDDGKAHIKRLPAMLQLAFWGGSRRRLPVACFDLHSVNHNLMSLSVPDEDQKQLITTNLHSLVGLTFRVATKDQLDRVTHVANVDIEVNGTAIGPALPDKKVWKELFGSLGDDTQDPRTKITLGIDDTFNNRAYVRQAYQSFQLVRNSTYFRSVRSSGSPHDCAPSTSSSDSWLPPTRFIARSLKAQSQEDQQWQAYREFEGTLRRYRLAPVKESGSDAGRTILQFIPSASAQAEFFTYFKKNFSGSNPAAIWKDSVFLADGAASKNGVTQVDTLTIRSDQQGKGDIYWIGSYDLPWDKYGARTERFVRSANNKPTLLFLGKEPPTSRVLLLFPQGGPFTSSFRSDDVQTAVGKNSSRQSLGDRWELKDGDKMPTSEFNVLHCLSGDAQNIVPQLCFPRLVEFDFAQSAGAIEGKVSVNYPPHEPTSYSAGNAILQELLNYNALIVVTNEHRQNLFGQILPSFTTMASDKCAVPSGGGTQGFEFRLEPPTDAPPQYDVDASTMRFLPKVYGEYLPKDWSTTKVARSFFKKLYEQMDQPRLVSFGIEHTLGASLTPSTVGPLPSPAYADFPVALPTEVVLRGEHEDKKQRSPDEDIPFLRVSYQKGNTPLTLHLHTALLDDQVSEGDTAKRQEARIAGCRAVAELAFAASIRIKPRIYHFDYTRAFQGAVEADVNGLGACIVSEEGPEWTCTELKTHCHNWIYQNIPLPKEIQCSQSTPLVTAHPNFLFVEFELRIDREPKRVPPSDDNEHWKLTWRPVPPGRPEDTDRASDNLLYEEFRHYLSTLKSRCAVIPALRTAAKEKSALDAAALIGGGAGSAAGWIFSDDVLTITAAPDVSTVICPIAFAPLSRDPTLGDATFEIVTRYMERIDSLMNYDPAWLTSDLTKLRKNFDSRVALVSHVTSTDGNGGKGQTSLWHVMEAVLNNLSTATKRKDEVATIAMSGDTLRPEVREQVSRLLWTSPRLFGDAKAFLCSVVQGGTIKQPASLFPEFVFFRSKKLIAKRLSTKLLDNHPQSFLQTIRVPSEGRSDLSFLEVLDERRYGDSFELSGAEWKGIRRMLREGIDSTTGGKQELGVWDQLPPAHIMLPSSAGASRHVHLPSREPVVPPNHVSSGYIEELQIIPPDYPTIDLTMLGQGKWRQGSDDKACATLTALSPRLDRSASQDKARPDEAFFSMLYWITGDEESQKEAASLAEVLQSYENDEFLLYERTDVWPTTGTDLAPGDSVFRNVLNTEDGEDLPAALESANLERLVKVLTAKPSQATDRANQNPTITLKLAVHKEGPVALCRSTNDKKAGWRKLSTGDGYEVSVLRHCSDAARPGARQRLLLLITAKVDLWTPKAFRLVLRRNFEYFDERFAQETTGGGSPYANQRAVLRDFSDREPISIKWRSNSLTNLVKELLLPRCFPDSPEPKWSSYDLSVTIRRIHKMTWMLSGSDGKGTPIRRDLDKSGGAANTSSFPLLNRKYDKGLSKSKREEHVCWFEEGTNEFFVDWLWSSQTNLPFLRLSGLRVTIAKEARGCEIEGKSK